MSVQRKYLEMFLEEGAEILAALDGRVLALERAPGDRASLAAALRLAHTLKGGAKMVGLDNVSRAAHQMESTLNAASGGGVLEAEACTRFLAILDRTRDALQLVAQGREAEALALDLAAPRPVSLQPSEPAAPLAAPASPAAMSERRLGADRVRVGVEKLDALQNLVDDLTLQKYRILDRLGGLRRMVRHLDSLTWDGEDRAFTARERASVRTLMQKLSSGEFAELFEEAHRLDQLVGEVQGHVFELRMVPLAEVLDEYQRTVRDLAGELGKEVNLTIDGKFTEIDKRLLEVVQGPLLHLVRNAVDHGVESPEERVAAGKPRRAEIVLRAFHKGSAVVIDVEDDGRGLDREEIRRAAVAKGVVSEQAAAAMLGNEAFYLLCEPGFSTRDRVTEVSGRGVGLDVVKVELEKAKGSVSISSEVGRFTRFRLYLPLSISSLSALIVRMGDIGYAVPSLFVDRCVQVASAELARHGGSWRFGDKVLPVVSLARVLGVEGARPPEKVYLVAVQYRSRQMLVQVDSLAEEREIVLKPLGGHLAEVPFVSGVSFHPNGEPIPVLNVSDLHRRWQTLEVTARFELQPVTAPPSILVADDSLTTRHMESNVLRGLGYQVVQAADGAEAWGLLQQRSADLVITDLEMPHMDGLELIRRIRGSESLARTPVVVVSTRGTDADQEAGFLAGADAYILKDRFTQRELGETLRGLLSQSRQPAR
ncbi:MAG: response regulator [Deferrisomatales bacterium]|nr:response regulator [Deferrisomatales bacterium]